MEKKDDPIFQGEREQQQSKENNGREVPTGFNIMIEEFPIQQT